MWAGSVAPQCQVQHLSGSLGLQLLLLNSHNIATELLDLTAKEEMDKKVATTTSPLLLARKSFPRNIPPPNNKFLCRFPCSELSGLS